MIIKNRKLVPREGVDVSAFNVAEIERMISEVPDEAWGYFANEKTDLGNLFSWSRTSQKDKFWAVIDDYFTVDPPLEIEIAELEATIAKAQKRLAELGKAQREGRTHADKSGNGGE